MKQDDRFFRLMHAVDDDLLEEAMQPVRRRRHVWIPLAAAAWLPVSDGEFHLFMRIYVPDMTALDSWQPPVIREQ